jgi:TonB family protein
MKIVCDACQAKYSISDDKVQGKVFKIRCKKCSNIIVVRGGAGGGAAADATPEPAEKDTRVYGYDGGGAPADDAVWHLVINQDQVGPMTAAEVQQRFSSGEVDAETFAWREGFADWLPLSQVDAFAGLATSGAAALPAGGGGAQAVSAMFGGGDDLGGTNRSDPGDLFAAASSTGGGRAADDGDLFGSKPAAAQQAANAQKLRGERNESSVLFSLNNLAQLASNSPAPAAAPSSAGHATGSAGGEGSGLIDIRSMASAYLGGGSAMAKPAASSAGVGSIDDLPVFGGVGFSEPAVLVPTGRASNDNKVLYAMIGTLGLVVVAAVIVVVVLLKSKPATVVAQGGPTAAEKTDDKGSGKGSDTTATDQGSGSGSTAAATGSSAAAPAAGSGGSGGSAAPAGSAGSAAPTQVAVATPPAPPTAPPAPPVHHDTPKATPTHVAATSGTSASSPARPPKADPPPKVASNASSAAPSDSGGGGCDEVSCVLNNYEGACCTKFKKGGNKTPSGGGGTPPPSSGGGGNLPAGLDRDSIQAGIASVKPKANACGDKSSAKGMVMVHVKVGGDGHVNDVSVEKSPDPALSACVAAAIKKGTFAKTQNGGSFRIPFTF